MANLKTKTLAQAPLTRRQFVRSASGAAAIGAFGPASREAASGDLPRLGKKADIPVRA
jgi:hypothetical protein